MRGVAFTGSAAGGAQVAALAGKHVKKSMLELGGSDAFIVLDDADLDVAVNQAVSGRLRNTGQACNNSKRFIIHSSLYDAFKKRLAEELKSH